MYWLLTRENSIMSERNLPLCCTLTLNRHAGAPKQRKTNYRLTRKDNGNEDGIGEGGSEAQKRKKVHKSCRRDVGNGGNLGGKRNKRRQRRVGSVAANPKKSRE